MGTKGFDKNSLVLYPAGTIPPPYLPEVQASIQVMTRHAVSAGRRSGDFSDRPIAVAATFNVGSGEDRDHEKQCGPANHVKG